MDKDDKNYINKRKAKGHCHYTGNLEELHIVYAISIIMLKKKFQ